MTRDEVVKGLDQALKMCACLKSPTVEADAIRAAIAWLTPPATAEIDAAREWLHCIGERPEDFGHKRTALRALDALSREPATEAVLHRKNCRIAVLEARLARVREWRAGMRGYAETHLAVAGSFDALDAALVADAEPTKEPR